MTLRVLFELLKETSSAWSEHKAPRLGAALAFYAVFSTAPLLVILIGIAGLVFGEQAARGEIVGQIQNSIGEPAAQALEEMLKHSRTASGGTLTTIIGITTLLLGALGFFVQLQDAFSTIWQVTPNPDRGSIFGILRNHFLAFTIVLTAGFLLLVSVTITVTLVALGVRDALPGSIHLWQILNGVISLSLITLFLGLLYKILPDVKLAWRDVWVGAIVTALLFVAGKYLIGLYLAQTSITSVFGAAGSLVVILLWVYYSSQILLFGAEFTRIYARKIGFHSSPTDLAVSKTAQVSGSAEAGFQRAGAADGGVANSSDRRAS